MKSSRQIEARFKLYNTMSRRVEEFIPLHPPQVGFYACGPTVYDFTHLGHLRRYTMDDVLIRTLRSVGFQVKFVQNITDVGHLVSDADTGQDKLEKGAQKYQQTVWQVAEKFTEYFFTSLDQLNVLRPDISCKATDYIDEQIEMVKELERKGYTYIIEGDGVYFDTNKLDDYGRLARLDIENLQAGARVEMVPGKRQPTDFALWKFEKQGESRQMSWSSPWSERGFPGWHIECSAMSRKHLGDQFEIHTGGMDHISVHHPNEIAQTESVTDKKPSVKYWVHHGVTTVDGQKMSKSLGNTFTIDDVKAKKIHPLALRLFFLSAHYRSELNFTWENLAGVDKAYCKLLSEVARWKKEDVSSETIPSVNSELAANVNPELVYPPNRRDSGSESSDYSRLFWSHLANDLDTPQALAVFWQVVKSDLSNSVKIKLLNEFDQVFCLGLFDPNVQELNKNLLELDEQQLPENVRELLAQRAQAKAQKNYQLADSLRQKLLEQQYNVIDTSNGVVVKKLD